MSDQTVLESALFFKPTKWIVRILLALFLLAGLAVRFIDLTDLPLDFATTRQLHSLIMARGLYYEMDSPQTRALPQDIREFGITTGESEPRIEPPIMEYLTAITYRVIGGENILVGRLYSILFWVLGGIPLFLLMRRVTSINGAFASLVMYLFVPFGILASRAFQPDPLMVMCILWSLYFQIRWRQEDNLRNAILVGAFTGLAVLVKATSVYFVGIPLVGLVLSMGIKKWIKNWHIYLIAALALIPAVAFNLISATIGGNAGAIFGARLFPSLYADPKWYLKWFMMAKSIVNYFPIMIGLLAFFVIRKKEFRIMYFCLWLGYLLFGFTFAYHMYTHNYYHLPIIPMTAMGMGLIFALVFEKLEELNRHWLPRILIVIVLAFSVGLCVIKARGDLLGASFRHEAKYWAQLGEKIGKGKSVIALTHDYGFRISYWGFINPKIWPTRGDQVVSDLSGATNPEFVTLFKQETAGKDYFLVTLIGDMEAQPDLHDYLFANFPYVEGDGYYLFDLQHPLPGAK
jgi:hypothetical protein